MVLAVPSVKEFNDPFKRGCHAYWDFYCHIWFYKEHCQGVCIPFIVCHKLGLMNWGLGKRRKSSQFLGLINLSIAEKYLWAKKCYSFFPFCWKNWKASIFRAVLIGAGAQRRYDTKALCKLKLWMNIHQFQH